MPLPVLEIQGRCFRCFRPASLCFCQAIPQIDNRTSILILQHRRERFHPFNTARIVDQSLTDCRLLVDHTTELADQFASYPLSSKAGLLYPGDDSQLLTALTPSELPDQLVVIDGTWHQAKTLLREIPRLQTLPRYRLAPATPGNYRIRREPNDHALSTLEATVAALAAIEPDTAGLDRLLAVFVQMIDNQIAHKSSNWRRNGLRQPGAPNIPRALMGDLSDLVVAYGEQERGERRNNKTFYPPKPSLIYWHAMRLVSGETFRCAIESPSFADPQFVKLLGLSDSEVQAAVSRDAFRERWQAFLRPHDQLVVYHPSTGALLENMDAAFTPALVLKSINLDGQLQHGSLEDFLNARGITPTAIGPTRAASRLANAVALIHHLHAYSEPFKRKKSKPTEKEETKETSLPQESDCSADGLG